MFTYLLNKGENKSGTFDLNLVAQTDRIYVIDNHLAAFWTWQQLDLSLQYDLLHVDRHYDWFPYFPEHDINVTKERWNKIRIKDLTGFKNKNGHQLIDWANYINLFRAANPNVITSGWICTQKDGDFEYKTTGFKEIEIYALFDQWFNKGNKWIFNIDVDFFFTTIGDDLIQLFTNEFIGRFGDWLKEEYDNVAQLVICLSPEYSRDWTESKRVANILLDPFGEFIK